MNSLMKSINGYGYITWYVTYHQIDKYYVKMTEKAFVERKVMISSYFGITLNAPFLVVIRDAAALAS